MLTDLAQQQQEIIRVAGLGLAQPTATLDTKNFAITAQVSMQSDQKAVLGIIAKNGTKLGPKNLGLKTNANTDAQLKTAAQNGVFDKTFVQILDSQLTTYSTALQDLYKSSKKATDRQFLQSSYKSAQLLLNDPAVKN